MRARQESIYGRLGTLIIVLLMGTSSQLGAGPIITGYTGSVAGSGQIVVAGAGFGTNGSAAPIKFDDFENGANGTALNKQDSSWQKYNDGVNFSNAVSHSGSLCVGTEIPDGESFNTNYFITDQPSDELFISYWWRTVGADVSDHTIVKLTRICSSEEAGGGGVYNGPGNTSLGGTFDFSENSGPYCAYNNGVTDEVILKYFDFPPLNAWLKIEMYKKLSTPGVKNGVMECTLLGVDHAIDTAALTRAAGKSFKLNSVLLGLMDGNAGSHHYQAYIDDIYINNTRARIEIGNAGTWSACSVREVQIPAVWTDTQLKFSIRLGAFAPSDKLYLYVVDVNGRVNATGYPLFSSKISAVPLFQPGGSLGFCDIACFRLSSRTMKLSASLAQKGELSLSVFDISGKRLWSTRVFGSLKSESIIPLPTKPFIVVAKQQKNSYSKIFYRQH
jgi:hypothetical protein